jgi:hypothetical protein
MTERDRAAVGIDVRRVVGQPEVARHRERLRREGLVELDHVMSPMSSPACEQLARARRRPKPMIRGGTPATRRDDARAALRPYACAAADASEQARTRHR